MSNLEKRMYFFVPYNISEIQKGIQAGHASLEYAKKYNHSEEYKDFIENWKTWIILNGGTTNNNYNSEKRGSLNTYCDYLEEHNIDHSVFYEPDLNNALTAICFICDSKCFDKDILDYKFWLVDSRIVNDLYGSNDNLWYEKALKNNDLIKEYKSLYNLTEKQFRLRNLITNKKLA